MGVGDVEPVYLGLPDAASAIAAGQVDAWATWDQYLAFAHSLEGLDTRGARTRHRGHDPDVHVVSRGLLETRPELVRAAYGALEQQAVAVEADPGLLGDAYVAAGATREVADLVAAARTPPRIVAADDAFPAELQAVADFYAAGLDAVRGRRHRRRRGRAAAAVTASGQPLPALAPGLGVHVRRPSTSCDGRVVLDRLDHEVRPGELVAMLGRNGSGKSTLVRALAGLHPGARRGHPEDRQRGVAFPEPRLLPWTRVWRNVAVALEGAGAPPSRLTARAAAVAMLEEVGLGAHADAWPLTRSGARRSGSRPGRALVRDRTSCCSTSRSPPWTHSRGCGCTAGPAPACGAP